MGKEKGGGEKGKHTSPSRHLHWGSEKESNREERGKEKDKTLDNTLSRQRRRRKATNEKKGKKNLNFFQKFGKIWRELSERQERGGEGKQ